MKTFSRLFGFNALGLLCAWAISLCGAEGSYKLLKEISIGGEGGWDYLSVDQDARRLYVSHATKVVAIDIDKDTVIGEIADTPGVHGIAIAPKLGLGYTSNGRENKASVFDLKTHRIYLASAKFGPAPAQPAGGEKGARERGARHVQGAGVRDGEVMRETCCVPGGARSFLLRQHIHLRDAGIGIPVHLGPGHDF